MNMEQRTVQIRPDHPYLHFLALLLLFSLLRGGSLGALVFFIGAYAALQKFGKVTVDDFYVTAVERPFSSRRIIIPRSEVRVFSAPRRFGPAFILNDRTSIQEIVLYEWLYSRKTLAGLRSLFAS